MSWAVLVSWFALCPVLACNGDGWLQEQFVVLELGFVFSVLAWFAIAELDRSE